AASLLCGLAWSEGVLVGSRALQGLGAAIISPAALSIITTTFEEGPERNKALGIWGAIGGSGAAVGVLAGGVLTKYLGWEWIFFVNVPFRIFRIRTVAGANVSALLLGGVVFANFFVLTLYVQQVLGWSALKTGVTFIATAGTSVLWAGLAQALVTRVGAKTIMAIGFVAMIGGMLWYTQIPIHASYWSDL